MVGSHEHVDAVVIVAKANLIARLVIEVSQEEGCFVGTRSAELVGQFFEHQQVGPVAQFTFFANFQAVEE